MMIAENDIELLELYLDGELEAAAQVELTNRLAAEKPLAEVLMNLQTQRTIRAAAFTSMEPNDVTTQQLMWRVRGAMLDQDRKAAGSIKSQWSHWSQWKIARVGSAAAACMVFGFLLGRLAHMNPNTPGASTIGQPVNMITTQGHINPQSTEVADRTSQFTPVGNAPRISVPITNEYGQVVAWQTFDNPEQAKNFTEELHQTHNAAQPSVNSQQPKLVDSPQQY